MNTGRRHLPPVPADTICVYCFDRWADSWDHVIPYSYIGDRLGKTNLVPACRRCNGLASNKMFDSLQEKREYVQNRIAGKDTVRNVRIRSRQEKTTPEVLQPKMPVGRVAPEEDKIRWVRVEHQTLADLYPEHYRLNRLGQVEPIAISRSYSLVERLYKRWKRHGVTLKYLVKLKIANKLTENWDPFSS
jgi:hypothetical protein